MKKLSVIASTFLLALLVFSSCNRVADDLPSIDEPVLRDGAWNVERMEVNSFSNGVLVETEVVKFGEGEQGGICTFAYTDASTWVMIDNGALNEFPYTIENNVITTEGGGIWGLRTMSDTYMELTLRGEESRNPCQFSASGAVYYLTRSANR